MHWPRLPNLLMLFLASCAAIFALFTWWPTSAIEKEATPLAKDQRTLPSPDVDPLDKIGGGCLALNRIMPWPKLPDLKQEFIYIGSNGRPDAIEDELYLATKGGEEVGVGVGITQYIALSGEGFAFTSKPTPLWITPQAVGEKEIVLEVGMETPEGEKITQPADRALIRVAQQEGRKGSVWQMGEVRVDSSLLARQRARWYGGDLFLTEHGGEDYQDALKREKIEFGEGANAYCCFIGLGEGLIWKGDRWSLSPLGPESRLYPLLVLVKQDERALYFELWDESGRTKTPITTIRSKDNWLPNHLKENLRFVAAKTWSQFVLEWGQARLHIRPGDWLLLDKEGWKILETSEDILEYAQGHLPGELLVIEGLVRNEGKHRLQGHLFNATRSDRILFEIPLTLEIRPGATNVKELAYARREGVFERPPPRDNPEAPQRGES